MNRSFIERQSSSEEALDWVAPLCRQSILSFSVALSGKEALEWVTPLCRQVIPGVGSSSLLLVVPTFSTYQQKAQLVSAVGRPVVSLALAEPGALIGPSVGKCILIGPWAAMGGPRKKHYEFLLW